MSMCESRFFICKHCGNLVGMINCSGVPIICCGEPMTELIPGSVDASLEKHVPVITVDGNTVTVEVGSVAHPMTEEHYIEWIYLETTNGGQPKATFALTDGAPVSAYAYCNLHGLWRKTV